MEDFFETLPQNSSIELVVMLSDSKTPNRAIQVLDKLIDYLSNPETQHHTLNITEINFTRMPSITEELVLKLKQLLNCCTHLEKIRLLSSTTNFGATFLIYHSIFPKRLHPCV